MPGQKAGGGYCCHYGDPDLLTKQDCENKCNSDAKCVAYSWKRSYTDCDLYDAAALPDLAEVVGSQSLSPPQGHWDADCYVSTPPPPVCWGFSSGQYLSGCVSGDNCMNHGSITAAKTACIAAGDACGGVLTGGVGHWVIRRGTVPTGSTHETSYPKIYCVPLPPVWVGCFANSGADRIGGHKNDRSIDDCLTDHGALGLGVPGFGMEYPQGYAQPGSAQCLPLSTVPPAMTQVADADCEYEKYNGLRLGGSIRLAVYLKPPVWVGCFANSGADRINGHTWHQTIDDCSTRALALGVPGFGLEFPQGSTEGRAQCLSLSTVPPAMTQVADADCTSLLHARYDPTSQRIYGLRLGGASRLAVYLNPPSPPPPLLPSAYPGDLNAWYCSGAFHIASSTWQDCSGNGKTATFSGSGLAESRSAGHGATSEVLALSGTTSSVIAFGAVIQSSFTVCSVTRYTGGAKGRILNGGGANWLHGHWGGNAGVAYYQGWKTALQGHVSPNTDWVVMCGTNAGSWNHASQLKLVNGVDVGTATGGTGGVSLFVNFPSESSDFAIAEVVVWPRGLTSEEMHRVSDHLMSRMG